MRTKSALIILLLTTISFASGQGDNEVQISEMSIDSMGDLKWTISYIEKDPLVVSQEVEQFKNNKWISVRDASFVIVREVACEQPSDKSKYSPSQKTKRNSIRVKFHSGENRYRIRVSGPVKTVSEEIVLMSNASNDDGSLWIVNNQILLDETVTYEIQNHIGATLSKGENKTIDISSLQKGSYFLYTKTYTKAFVK